MKIIPAKQLHESTQLQNIKIFVYHIIFTPCIKRLYKIWEDLEQPHPVKAKEQQPEKGSWVCIPKALSPKSLHLFFRGNWDFMGQFSNCR